MEMTQNPTPQEVSRMDKMKIETDSLVPVPKAKRFAIPPGMKIDFEPYFGTIKMEYVDSEIGSQIKIEVFKPGS